MEKKEISYEEFQAELQVVRELIERAQLALDCLSLGDTDAFLEAVDELYLESREAEANNALNYFRRMIQHLFKLKYGTRPESFKKLRREIENFRDEAIDLINRKGKTGKPNKNISDRVTIGLQDAYESAIRFFGNDIKDDPEDYKIQDTKSIPSKCPWTLTELMDQDIEILLTSLET